MADYVNGASHSNGGGSGDGINEGSPLVWKKPSDIMKLRKLKQREKKLKKRLGYFEEDEGQVVSIGFGDKQMSNAEAVFLNPFRNSPIKRQKVEVKAADKNSKDFDVNLLQRLQATEAKNNKLSQRLGDLIAGYESQNQTPRLQNDEQEEKDEYVNYLPVDWSLKSAIRLTSPNPLPWSGRMTTPEEASGVTSFARCLPLYGGGLYSRKLDTSPNSQLLQCCQIWMHPSIPWLNSLLFPRQALNKKSAQSATAQLHPQAHPSMHMDWCESFRCLFHLLRARQCPFFYLCANEFTVLFRAAGVGSNSSVHAFITPTSTGFRASLQDENIEFTMPLSGSSQFSTSSQSSAAATDEDGEELGEVEGETDEWLKSVGVDARIMTDHGGKKKSGKSVDYSPQSLIYVEDSNAHALFNYLLNSKRCIPTWGPLSGVPPTLLSPIAFTGGTLRSLQMRHRQSQKLHVLDIVGPILPHVIHSLHMILTSRSPTGDFELTLSTVDATASFSSADEKLILDSSAAASAPPPPAVFSQQGLSDCGLESQILTNMCLPLNAAVFSQVHVKSGKTKIN